MTGFTAYIASFGATLLAAMAGSVASVAARDFYQALTKPSWAPPAGVFGPVWTLLYLMIATAGGLVLRVSGSEARGPARLFFVQLGLNALWSWTFFAWKSGPGSMITITALWVTIVATMIAFWRVDRIASVLMVPYLGWVTFAAALNLTIWRLNQGPL